MKRFACLLVLLCCAPAVPAGLHTETVEYRDGDTVLEGYLAWDDSIRGRRPAVVIVHQWKGLTDYEKKRADKRSWEAMKQFFDELFPATD